MSFLYSNYTYRQKPFNLWIFFKNKNKNVIDSFKPLIHAIEVSFLLVPIKTPPHNHTSIAPTLTQSTSLSP